MPLSIQTTERAISNSFLRRELENRLVAASYEVAPHMNDHDRLHFVQEMLSTLSAEDAAAILGH